MLNPEDYILNNELEYLIFDTVNNYFNNSKSNDEIREDIEHIYKLLNITPNHLADPRRDMYSESV